MSKVSQQVQNQVSVSGKVVASAKAHIKKVAAALAEQLPDPPAPFTRLTVVQWEGALHQLASLLGARTEELERDELAYTAEQADDGPIRQARDAKVAELVAMMVRLRSVVNDNLGREALRTYGLHTETPRTPRKLLGYVGNVVHLMGEKPASVSSAFGSFDTGMAAGAVAAEHAALKEIIGDDDREARELEEALTQRDRASIAWTRGYQGVALVLEGLYRLAGWTELADRVRPTQRTIRGEDAGEEIEGGEENPGEEGGGGGGSPAGS